MIYIWYTYDIHIIYITLILYYINTHARSPQMVYPHFLFSVDHGLPVEFRPQRYASILWQLPQHLKGVYTAPGASSGIFGREWQGTKIPRPEPKRGYINTDMTHHERVHSPQMFYPHFLFSVDHGLPGERRPQRYASILGQLPDSATHHLEKTFTGLWQALPNFPSFFSLKRCSFKAWISL